MDNILFSFKGVRGDEILSLKEGKSDDQIVGWLETHGIPKKASEVTEWSTGIESYNPSADPEKKEWFSNECQSLGLNPEETTLCEMLEGDDYRSFAALAVH